VSVPETASDVAAEAGRAPFSAIGAETDRGPDGRFVANNRAALVVGQHSAAFWTAQAEARRQVRLAILADAGHTEADAPEALRLAANSIAQATLLQDSAFARLAECAGPLTSRGRARRAYTVWLTATDRLERYLRLVGLKRVPKYVDPMEAVRRAVEEANR
jgi:hypothetical protein